MFGDILINALPLEYNIYTICMPRLTVCRIKTLIRDHDTSLFLCINF